MHIKTNIKTWREIKDKNSNSTIFSNDEKENEDIFSMQTHMFNSIKPSYFQVKSQQISINTNSKQLLTFSLLISSKLVV